MATQSVSDKTLFVWNLPYGTSDKELEAVFCEYGELKSCFTVKEKGIVDRCRGFGYVTFTKREDAERAKCSVKIIGSRPVQLSFATRKPPRKKGKKKGGEEEVKNPGEEMQKGGGEERGPDEQGVKKSGEERRTQGGRHRGGAQEVDNSIRSDGESDGESEKESDEEESEDDYETRTAQARGDTLKHCKPRSQRGEAKFDVGRVVVLMHLPDNTSEKWLRKNCKKFGAIEHIQYPVPNREVPTAFVTFESYKDARCAVEGLNGATHRGTALAAVLLSRENKEVSKKTLRKSRLIVRNLSFLCSKEDVRKVFSAFGEVTEVHIPRKPNGHMLGYAFVQFTSYISAMKALEGMNAKKLKGRPVAVDWVVPKEKYELSLREKGGGVEEEEGEGGEVTSQSDSMNEQSLGEKGEEEEEMDEGESDEARSEREEDDSSSEELSLEEEEVEGGRSDLKEDVQEGKTVFVRNVPFDVAEDELRQLFTQFGGVRYCRLVSNPDTGMARGSAFVQFYDPTAVQHCLEAASVKPQQDLCLHGRQLDVSMALSKQEMERLRKHKSSKREKVDKRNLYLAKEGVILPDSEAAKDLSKADLTKRMKAHREKKAKLANPNFFVSKTRLSIRNLPTQVDEKQLKSLFLKAAGGPPAAIKQVKILRSTERVDGKGVARSKGFAFVEFSSHDAAVTALRATNNNPELFGSKKRLIVEFALEDSRALKLREQRKKRQLASKKSSSGREKSEPKHEENEEKKSKLLAKKEKWKLKRKAKRLRQKESQSNQDHSTTKSLPTKVSPQSSEALLRTAKRLLAPDAVANSTTKVQHDLTLPKVGAKRKANHQDFSGLAVEKRPRVFQTKPKRAEVKEEAEFTQMVANYKKKLFGTASESRWFE